MYVYLLPMKFRQIPLGNSSTNRFSANQMPVLPYLMTDCSEIHKFGRGRLVLTLGQALSNFVMRLQRSENSLNQSEAMAAILNYG